MPGIYIEGNKRIKYFPLQNNSRFGKKTQKKNKKNYKNIKKLI
jgi:hypothetical protein